ncbi:MAG TPA: penicillin-binding transpeptidase domain-containing protein [Candidatus Angelobacter sp.]|nr:penicillin-binding transpeptidase domain-containing protein [Candidatus Angelobacter sp.]
MPQKRAHLAKNERRAGNGARENAVAKRLVIVAALALVWMTAVFGRLGYLQLFQHTEYLKRAAKQQQRIIEITPKRGAIYDRNGHPLAMSIPADSVFAVPTELGDAQLEAQLLSKVLAIPSDTLEARMNSGQPFVWLAHKITPDKKEAVEALNLKGVYFQKENQRIYPKRDLAAHVLGFVDLDEKGLGGIEYELDKQIRGKSEKIVVMADAHQRWFDGGEAQREHGADVILTLDEKVQYIAERELAAAIAKTHAMAGTAMVMNPNTGEILALANWPKFNPNMANEAPADARMNRAVTALYEPGSTFKLITLAAAFDQGMTTPSEVFDCENGAVYIAGHRIRDHKPFGLLTVSDILAQSSDVGAIKIALRLGAPKFYDYLRAFGFGQLTGVDLPGESKGLLRRLENWSAISIGSISMGQEVGVTPIQLISAVSAIANGGVLYKPHVVAKLQRGETTLPAEGPLATAEPKRVIRPETAATLRRMMEGVILNGTGTLAHLEGWTAAGKTGSAQKIDPATGRYSATQLIASFTGFAPISNPAVTILVSLDSPVGEHEGGQVAAPVFKRIAEQVLPYLEVPRDVPIGPRFLQASYQRTHEKGEAALEDFTPTDFSAQPDQPPVEFSGATAKSKQSEAAPVTAAVDQGGDIAVPDFTGKTVREVTEACLRLGLEPVLVGSGLALNQKPAAEMKLRRGAKLTVQFGTPEPKFPKTQQKTRR